MERIFTQRMTLHINGGSDHSSLHYDVLCDGAPTNIKRVTVTNGSPEYKKTKDVLVCGDGEEFDVLAARGVGLVAWLEKKVPANAESKS